jgi:hypothetical protein
MSYKDMDDSTLENYIRFNKIQANLVSEIYGQYSKGLVAEHNRLAEMASIELKSRKLPDWCKIPQKIVLSEESYNKVVEIINKKE